MSLHNLILFVAGACGGVFLSIVCLVIASYIVYPDGLPDEEDDNE